MLVAGTAAAEAAYIESRASALIEEISKQYLSSQNGTWTVAIYDTAWVSMVVHPDGHWAFPECFQYVLDSQSASGGWLGGDSQIDGILNTMAALLAIQKHRRRDESSGLSGMDLNAGLEKATSRGLAYLQEALNGWRVEDCMHVGFEILVPALQKMLASYSINIEFPGQETVMALNAQKLSKFNIEWLYGPQQLTVLHSLEAFIDTCDFL